MTDHAGATKALCNVYVADVGNNRTQKFTSARTPRSVARPRHDL